MKYGDIKNKTKQELMQSLQDLKAKTLQLNFELAEKRLKDFTQIKKTKKDIARILTALRRLKS